MLKYYQLSNFQYFIYKGFQVTLTLERTFFLSNRKIWEVRFYNPSTGRIHKYQVETTKAAWAMNNDPIVMEAIKKTKELIDREYDNLRLILL
jgi:hypothetical protein